MSQLYFHDAFTYGVIFSSPSARAVESSPTENVSLKHWVTSNSFLSHSQSGHKRKNQHGVQSKGVATRGQVMQAS